VHKLCALAWCEERLTSLFLDDFVVNDDGFHGHPGGECQPFHIGQYRRTAGCHEHVFERGFKSTHPVGVARTTDDIGYDVVTLRTKNVL